MLPEGPCCEYIKISMELREYSRLKSVYHICVMLITTKKISLKINVLVFKGI